MGKNVTTMATRITATLPRNQRPATGRRRPFSLIELLLACGLILFIANVILRIFSDTVDLVQAQVGTHQIYNTALYAMSTIETDIRGIRTMNVRPGDNDVRLYGIFSSGNISKDTLMSTSPLPTPPSTGSGYYPRLAFVTSFPEGRLDVDNYTLTGSVATSAYDGYVFTNTPTMGSGGLKEVCYTIKTGSGLTDGQGFVDSDLLNLHRLVRSPIGTPTSNSPSTSLFISGNCSTRSILARNVIYFGVRYLQSKQYVAIEDSLGEAFLDTDEASSLWTSTTSYPDYIEVTLSLSSIAASAQQEGRFTSDGAFTQDVNITLSNDNFRPATPLYFVDQDVRRAYMCTEYTLDRRVLTLKQNKWGLVPGCPAESSTVRTGHRVVFGTTFMRRIPIGL